MDLQYDFLAPPKIVFGWGRCREIGPLAARLGRRAFIVSGSRRLMDDGVIGELTEALSAAGVEPIHVAEIHREPQVERR